MSAHTVQQVLPKDHEALPDTTRYDLSEYDHILSANLTLPRLVFPTSADLDQLQVITNLKVGLANVLTYMPFVGGKVYNDTTNGTIYVLRQNHEPVDLGINRLDAPEDSFPDYATLAAQNFPMDFLSQNMSKLVPPGINATAMFRSDGSPVATFQVNFIKGGIILTLGMNHLFGDAKSIDHVYTLWASSTKAAFSSQPLPKFKPSLDRSYFTATSIPGPEELESLKKDIKGFFFSKIDPNAAAITNDPPKPPPTSNEAYHFSAAACNRLKEALAPTEPGSYISTYDCVVAATWRAMTKSRMPYQNLTDSSTTRVIHAVDIRGRFPNVPTSYFGNAFWMALTDPIDVGTLLSSTGLAKAALAVRKATLETTDSTIPNYLRVQRAVAGKESIQLDYQPANVIGTSWTGMQTEKFDFGFGLPRSLGLSNANFEGALTILPAIGPDGRRDGVHACVALEKGCSERMKADEDYAALYKE